MSGAQAATDVVLTIDVHLIDVGSGEPRVTLEFGNRLDEASDAELSLEQLSGLRGGVGLVDAMVSSSILMVIVAQSTQLFGHSMQALNKGKLRDGLNAAISADLERVRHEVSDWARTSGGDGQLAYQPSEPACRSGALGEALLADKQAQLPVASSIDLTQAFGGLKGLRVNRSISLAPENKNLIRIAYTTVPESSIQISQSTTLTPPAQGWCA